MPLRLGGQSNPLFKVMVIFHSGNGTTKNIETEISLCVVANKKKGGVKE